jgi:hypothetical protein
MADNDNGATEQNVEPKVTNNFSGNWLIGIGVFTLLLLAAVGWLGYWLFPVSPDRAKFIIDASLNAFILAAILLQVYVYFRQREVMTQQWEAMREQYLLMARGLTHQVKAHTAELHNMELQAEVTVGQLAAMQGQLVETRKIVGQNESAVVAMQKSASVAEAGVKIARRSMIYAQRAYVMIASGRVQIVDRNALFELKVRNYGNTPANDVRVFAVAEVREKPPLVIDMRSATWSIVGVVAPHADVIRFVATKEDILPAQSELMEKGKMGLYVWGAIEYSDVFPDSNTHQTKFSFAQRFGSTEIGPCATNNEAF